MLRKSRRFLRPRAQPERVEVNVDVAPWANPYKWQGIGIDAAVRAYRWWVLHDTGYDASYVRNHVHELHGKRLFSATPARSHAEVLRDLAQQRARGEQLH